MERLPVDSSNLRSIGYDLKKQVLEVEFQSGEIYDYLDVPEVEFNALKNAPSIGQYFAKNIRNDYRFKHVAHA